MAGLMAYMYPMETTSLPGCFLETVLLVSACLSSYLLALLLVVSSECTLAVTFEKGVGKTNDVAICIIHIFYMQYEITFT